MGGNIYIKFRPAWKPGQEVKIFRSAAAPGGMKNYRLLQLAGPLLEGPGTLPGEVSYGSDTPPMVEVTMGVELTFPAGEGLSPS